MNASENEDAILSCMLAYPDQSSPLVCAELRPDHFLPPNSGIFREILALVSEGQGIDVMAVAGRLRDAQLLETIGGFPRLSGLSMAGILPSNLPEHIRSVKDKAAQRRICALLAQKGVEAQSAGCNVSELTAELLGALEEIGHDRAKRNVPTLRELCIDAVSRIQKRYAGEVDSIGVSTGIKRLDKETGGIRPGAQWVIAGPSKGGKSALAGGILKAVAVDAKQRCAFFGLEMPSVENVERLLCHIGRVSASSLRDGKLGQHDFGNITAAASRLSAAPILFRDDIFDLGELLGTIRQMKAAYPDLFAVFVDYAQLLGGEQDEKNREREVAVISRSLRKVSMQHGLCIILLSQVNDDGKLRESRALGMDATKVVFIEFTDDPGKRKIRIVQRDGGSGVEFNVAYIGEHFHFADLANDEPDEPTPKRKPKRRWND